MNKKTTYGLTVVSEVPVTAFVFTNLLNSIQTLADAFGGGWTSIGGELIRVLCANNFSGI